MLRTHWVPEGGTDERLTSLSHPVNDSQSCQPQQTAADIPHLRHQEASAQPQPSLQWVMTKSPPSLLYCTDVARSRGDTEPLGEVGR